MIRQEASFFHLTTNLTSYCFRITEQGFLQHLYYGPRLDLSAGWQALVPQVRHLPGNAAALDGVGLEDMALEVSFPELGDLRQPFAVIRTADGSLKTDFRFQSAEILPEKPPLPGLPSSYDESGKCETLRLTLRDAASDLTLDLLYTTFDAANVIARSAALRNDGERNVSVLRLMSNQVDLEGQDYLFTTFNGAWAREFEPTHTPCGPGDILSGSRTGTSSSRANPFVMLREKNADEEHGLCYGFHLIYSGDHFEAVSGNAFGKLRFLQGIQPEGFSWQLAPGDTFTAPESFMTCARGADAMSRNLHRFIREHIVRGRWKHRERPILVNSWESFYFRFDHRSLVRLAKEGKALGAELFVLDDGWFGKRDSDTCSLGDWTVIHQKKLPRGLKALAEDVTSMGMLFGIWVEPEMVSEDSDLFRAHPDWILGRADQAVGRNQYILDLSRPEVCAELTRQLTELLSSAPISYVKWDMNRIFTDTFSSALPAHRQGEVRHRYMLGLYGILELLTARFPDVLFEACASGGNRTDPGMLCSMPQVWLSDNTDALCRCRMQYNASFGYPQSVMGAHVSSVPNHQTLRRTDADTRFHVAAFGLLGYECNLCELPKARRQQIAAQIALYKTHRQTLQYGQLHRLQSGGFFQLMAVSRDQKRALALLLQQENRPNAPALRLKARGLAPRSAYRLTVFPTGVDMRDFGGLVNMISPVHIRQGSLLEAAAARFMNLRSEEEDVTASGDLLMQAGVWLKQSFSGTGYDEETRVMGDCSSRLYLLEQRSDDSP